MKKQNNIHAGHRDRMKETFEKVGLESFSIIEKLEFLLFFAIPQKDVNPISHALLDEFKTIDNVLSAPLNALLKVPGVGNHTALMIKTVFAFVNEYGKSILDKQLCSTSSAKQFAKDLYRGKIVEEFTVVCLTSQNRIINYKTIATGYDSKVAVAIRDITAFALSCKCTNILLIHNHPHGTCEPSLEDITFTQNAITNGVLNGLVVLDHIIVNNTEAASMEELNIMSQLRKSSIETLKLNYQDIDTSLAQKPINYSK